jgi:hypothetical protein
MQFIGTTKDLCICLALEIQGFFAEFTVSLFATLRAIRGANRLRMTVSGTFPAALLGPVCERKECDNQCVITL